MTSYQRQERGGGEDRGGGEAEGKVWKALEQQGPFTEVWDFFLSALSSRNPCSIYKLEITL